MIQLLGPDPMTDAVKFLHDTLESETAYTLRVPANNRLKFDNQGNANHAADILRGNATDSQTPYVWIQPELFDGDILRTANAATGTMTLTLNAVTGQQSSQLLNELQWIFTAVFAQWRTSPTPYPNQPTYYKTVAGGDSYNAFLDNVSGFRFIPPNETPGGRWAWGLACTITIKLDVNPADM